MRRQIAVLSKNKYKKALQHVFNEDQIQYLISNTKRIKHWRNDTLQRAFKLKLSCGTNGYEELRQQNIPLPKSADFKA